MNDESQRIVCGRPAAVSLTNAHQY